MITIFQKPTQNESVFGLIYFLLQLFIVPGIIMVINTMLPQPYPEAVVNFVFFAINFIVVTILFRRYILANLRLALVNPWFTIRCAGIGLLIYFAGNAIFGLLITLVDPDFANINDAAIMEMVQDHFGLMTVGTVFLVPIVEECFYRGLIFRNIYDKSPVLAYAVSMVIFSLAHVLGYVGSTDVLTLILCFFQYLPPAFALAWSYRRSGSIFAPVLIHMTVNQIGMLSMR